MGTSEIVLEKVQALLKIDTGDGSLHEHLVRLSRKLAEEKPGEALAQLETLSRHLKQSGYRGASAVDEIMPIAVDSEAEDALLQWCSSTLTMVRPSIPAAPPKVLGTVQNIMDDAAMLRWAGIGFGQQESYQLTLSLRQLASETPSITSLRLWGKVLGTEADYYVAEGVLQSIERHPDAPPPPPILPDSPEYDVEPRGDGANAFTYWVSLGGCAPWVRLPAARASHIRAARSIKYLMTGSLDSPVSSMPWFPGKERHLLRAQIARISATCNLAPKGWYEEDDGGKIKEVENPLDTFPALEELETENGWAHSMPCLNKFGKSGQYPDPSIYDDLTPPLSDQQLAAVQKIVTDQATDDPEVPGLLSGLESDLATLKPDGEENNIAWSFKAFGDKGMYKFADEDKCHKVVAARSLIWPGAVAAAQGKKFANIYIGYALKCGSLVPSYPESGYPLVNTSPFFPLVPDKIMDEPQDLEEHDEPNPNEDGDGDDDAGSVDEDPDAA
jgi:hypothetical protein